jgi:leucyl-tRNA synthetase
MYKHEAIESKWQSAWKDKAAFAAQMSDKPKYYVLDMFPYPSGKGLHVGHLKGYVASDVVSRYRRARGYEVLHPMGWDSFGLPTERQAQKERIRPEEVTRRNIAEFRRQLDAVGLSFDWSREFATSDPRYYKWTQWIFSKLFERGLAYCEEVAVNWCPAMGTVLANEEVVDGKYVDTGDPIERRLMRQWMLRITAYADRLLDDLALVDWPEPIKLMQSNWIGRSHGATIRFELQAGGSLETFTTRPDTIFGTSFLVIAPEHGLLDFALAGAETSELGRYVRAARQRSDLQRMESGRPLSGSDTGLRAIHPASGRLIPVWTSDYVLGSYGTGAVMGVPAHDHRDLAFAKAFALPIIPVVTPPGADPALSDAGEAYTGLGTLCNSSSATLALDGLPSQEAMRRVIDWLASTGKGAAKTHYKLRDWLFSRQRYWGEPIPILFDGKGHPQLVPNDALPVELPYLETPLIDMPGGAAEGPAAPLARAPQHWLQVQHQGDTLLRETNTMPQWAGSCWYYLRFADPHNDAALCSRSKEQYWLPVDLYVGGAEHATLHLLYARFWHKFLFDIGLVSTPEPFARLFNQGMVHATSYRDAAGKYYAPSEVQGVNGAWQVASSGLPVVAQTEKMSKSKNNGVPPETVIAEYGADALRMFEMFMGPVEDGGLWSGAGVKGTHRFLDRLWRLFETRHVPALGLPLPLERALQRTIRSVTQDIETLALNTAISTLMDLLNVAAREERLGTRFFDILARLLQPFAPHFAEELWSQLGGTGFVCHAPWPAFDEALCALDELSIAVQINGKTRGVVRVAAGADEAMVMAAARREVPALAQHASFKKLIFVPGKIVNLVL